MRLFDKYKKKGQLNALSGLAVGIATLAITLTIAFLVMSEGRTQVVTIEGLDNNSMHPTHGECYSSIACNSTAKLQTATDGVAGWVPLIIIAVIGSILLGLVSLFRR